MSIVVALFMLVQLNIPRWLASLTMKPVWTACVLVGCLSLWIGIIFLVSAPYVKYITKDQQLLPPQRIGKDLPPGPPPQSIKRQVRIPVENKKDKSTSYKMITVEGFRRPADVGFRLLAFDMNAGRARAVTTLLLIIAASSFGCLISFILREPNILLPVAGLAAYVDVWTVLVGPTSKVLEEAPHVVSAVAAAIPSMGGASSGFAPIAFIGPADFIFFALFLAAAYRLKMEPKRTFWIAFPLLTIGMITVLSNLFPLGLPALTLIGVSVILGNYKHFKLKRDEYIAMGIVAVLLIAAIFVVTPLIRPK